MSNLADIRTTRLNTSFALSHLVAQGAAIVQRLARIFILEPDLVENPCTRTYPRRTAVEREKLLLFALAIVCKRRIYDSSDAEKALIDIADECRWTANLYAPYGYDRPQPSLVSQDSLFCTDLLAQCHERNTRYTRGSSTDLFVIENGLLFNRSVYKTFGDEILQMYETNRPNDPPWRADLDPALDLRQNQATPMQQRTFFTLVRRIRELRPLVDRRLDAGAIASRAFSTRTHPGARSQSYFPLVDSVREQSLRALTYDVGDIEVIFVNYRSAYSFRNFIL